MAKYEYVSPRLERGVERKMLGDTSLDVRNGFAADAQLHGKLGLGQPSALAAVSNQPTDFAALVQAVCGHN